ncbi:MAG: site-specific DNA-methyltransferase [Myxococcales bacterium]|nr:site-specific DNA-methyltransferase [Myxococcales bacterium]MCB9756512.1 site-specific DNA-methyltransferase [Myxococcales bacterium]
MPRSRPRAEKAITVTASSRERASIERAAAARGLTPADYLLELHARAQAPEASPSEESTPRRPKLAIRARHGRVYHGDSRALLDKVLEPASVDLVVTSPPYGLVFKKSYGNEDADRYLEWFRPFARGLRRVLKPSGSLVIDIGGAWNRGEPTRSLYHFKLLVMLCEEFGFKLAQEFYWWNPARLPSPAEWVNVRRIRVKDAIDCVWWLSPTAYPRASNRRVLQPYSADMERLLRRSYRVKSRPSGHAITDKFNHRNRGSIPPNLLVAGNNESNSAYIKYCQERGLTVHPARFSAAIPRFFVRMLTDPGDLVVDPFGGSCVTGEVCEALGRQWRCCELREEYIDGARGRFQRGRDDDGAPTGGARAKPYELWAPALLDADEDEAPLADDGGRARPSS